MLVLPECAGAIARALDEIEPAHHLVELVRKFPNIQLIVISEDLAQRASAIAADYKLRGADSIYVAVAKEYDATLITLDAEMLERGAKVVKTQTPEGWLKSLGMEAEESVSKKPGN